MRGTSPSKKPRGGCCEKDVQKCTKSRFGGVCEMCTKKNVPRGKDSTSQNPPLYIVLKAAFSAHRVFFLFFETNATLRVLKTKKAQFQLKFIPHFCNNAQQKFFFIKFFFVNRFNLHLQHSLTSQHLQNSSQWQDAYDFYFINYRRRRPLLFFLSILLLIYKWYLRT